MRTSVSPYHRHCFPAEINSHGVWLYFRFALSFRDVDASSSQETRPSQAAIGSQIRSVLGEATALRFLE